MAADKLILEHLRAIRAALADHGERLDHIEGRLASIEKTLGHLFAIGGSDLDAVLALARRVERIERRLDRADD